MRKNSPKKVNSPSLPTQWINIGCLHYYLTVSSVTPSLPNNPPPPPCECLKLFLLLKANDANLDDNLMRIKVSTSKFLHKCQNCKELCCSMYNLI